MPGEHHTDRLSGQARLTEEVTRGTERLLTRMDLACLREFPLRTHRRVDLAGLDRKGRITFVEVKTAPPDCLGDTKWPGYLDFCDYFYFAIPPGFPRDVVDGVRARAPGAGLILADAWGGDIAEPADERPLAAQRRRALTLAFARRAALRQAPETPRY